MIAYRPPSKPPWPQSLCSVAFLAACLTCLIVGKQLAFSIVLLVLAAILALTL